MHPLHFLYQKGNLIRIKTGLDTHLIRIQTRTPLSRYPADDYSNLGKGARFLQVLGCAKRSSPKELGLWSP